MHYAGTSEHSKKRFIMESIRKLPEPILGKLRKLSKREIGAAKRLLFYSPRFTKTKQRIKSVIGRRYDYAYIEPITSCQLKCSVCPVSSPPCDKVPASALTVNMAREIIRYLSERLHIDIISTGNWGEPFLNKDLLEILKVAKHSGIKKTNVNSNLSLKIDLKRLVRENNLNVLNVSMSGLTQDVYQIYHRGGTVDIVLKNIDRLVELKRIHDSPLNVTVRWHRFKHNEHQLAQAKAYFTERGVLFNPYYAHPGCLEHLKGYFENDLQEQKLTFIRDSIFTDFMERACRANASQSGFCRQRTFLTVHSDGHILLCCALYSSHLYKSPKPLIEMSPEEVKSFKERPLPFCSECLRQGWSGYFNEPKTDKFYQKLRF